MTPFTQYLRPNGEKRTEEFPCDEETQVKADKIIAAGYVFECKVLRGDVICSFTITDPEEGDMAIELCPNGPRVTETVKKLVMNFDMQRRSNNEKTD